MNEALRRLVWTRAGRRCEYCRIPEQFDAFAFEIDHIVAEKHRGLTTADNLALSCYQCNIYKGPNIAGIDPESGLVVQLFHPRQAIWDEHFAWDGAWLRGHTPVGRATVEVLRINHPDRVEQRRRLLLAGDYPTNRPE